MSVGAILAGWVLGCATAAGVGDAVDELKLTDGTVYREVRVVAVEPDGLQVLHRDGGGKVAHTQMSAAQREAYGIDLAAAEAHAAAARERHAREVERLRAEEARRRERLAIEQELAALAVDAELRVEEVREEGLICSVRALELEEHVHVRRVVENSLANQVRARPLARLERDVHWAVREEPWRERILLTGMPDYLVDGDVIALTMVPLGRYQYHDTEGKLRTLRRYGPVEGADQ